ncbi:ABC transporter substrate-binding protein [Sorangium sp. So ce363]|uniref:ABC transporter substrate-binding protein n=1 Tax=Sorangium sp. So ce363 TaxID=3133304 RepID=UPI003F622E70
MQRRQFLGGAAAAVSAALLAGRARAAGPSVIRVGVPGVGVGNRPVTGGSFFSLLHLQGTLAEEFKKDGIEVKWNFFRGAGPAVNEAVANNLLDIWTHGHLPSVVGRASGLKTRLLASASRRGHAYLVVPADSPITGVRDLRGKKVAFQKGTASQLSANRILEGHGLSEKDIRSISMDASTAKAAIATKDIDAVFGGTDYLSLRDQGIAKIVYTTKGDSPTYPSNSGIIAREDFINEYPDVVQKIITLAVKSAAWVADEKNRTQAFQLWSKSGTPFANYKEAQQGEDMKQNASPLLDEYAIARYKSAVADSKKYGLIRSTFEVEPWTDRRFLNRALKDAGLERFWAEWDANGKPKG